MKTILYISYLFCSLEFCSVYNAVFSNEAISSTFGTEFIFAFPQFTFDINHVNQSAVDLYIWFTNMDSQMNNINMTEPNATYPLQLQLSQHESVQTYINKNVWYVLTQNSTTNIFLLTSQYAISVHATIQYNNVGDSFLVLPTNVWGTHYIVTTADANTSPVNQIIVLPLKDQPALVSHPSCSGTDTINTVVSFPAAYMLTCAEDLSGFVITSNASIGVMSVLMSLGNSYKFGTEMLIPDKYWGSAFSLTNSTPNVPSNFKIVASRNGTFVSKCWKSSQTQCTDCTEKWADKTLNMGDSIGYSLIKEDTQAYIETNYPISIFQIPKNDMFSIYVQIPSLSNYITSTDLLFTIPKFTSIENYGTIQQVGANVLAIDGFQLQTANNIFNEVSDLHYQCFSCGIISSLHFNESFALNTLDLNSAYTHPILYSMIQYGVTQSSLIYGHVTALTMVSNYETDLGCDSTTTIPGSQTLSSSYSPHSTSTSHALLTITTPYFLSSSTRHTYSQPTITQTTQHPSTNGPTPTSKVDSSTTISTVTLPTDSITSISSTTSQQLNITTMHQRSSSSMKTTFSTSTPNILHTSVIQYNTTTKLTTLTTNATEVSNHTAPTLRTTTMSQISTIIQELANTSIANVTEVTTALTTLNDTLTEVSQIGYQLSAEDLKNVANILCNCSIIHGLLDQDFYLYMDSYNQVLNTNIQTIRDAQAIYNSSLYYQFCLHYMASNTVNSSLVYSNNNVASSSLDTDCSQIDVSDTSAVAFVQYANLSVELISNLSLHWFGSIPSDAIAAFAILPAISLCDAALSQNEIIRNDFVLYQGQQFFGSKSNNYSSTSNTADGCGVERSNQTNYVVTVKILTNLTKAFVQLSQPISFGFTIKPADKSLHSRTLCGYWDLEWRTNGCYLKEVQDDLYICQCTHLTDFSLLVDSSATDPALCDQTLLTLGVIVCVLSVASLFASLVLKVVRKVKFQSQLPFLNFFFDVNRKAKSVIDETLIAMLFLFYTLFAILSDSRVTNMSAMGCNVAGAVLYTVLFATMFFAAFGGLTFFKVYYIVFRRDVLNVVTSKWFVAGISLGIPTLISIILWYSFRTFFIRNDNFCWINPSFVVFAILIPTSILIIGDIIITALLIKGFFFTGSNSIQSSKGRKKIIVMKVFVLATVQIILACPWIFQYFTIGTPEVTLYHYLFTLTNGTQGIWLSMIYLYSLFRFFKKDGKPNKLKSSKDQLEDTLPTQSTPDMLANRRFGRGITKNSEPIAIVRNGKADSLETVSVSGTTTKSSNLSANGVCDFNSLNDKKPFGDSVKQAVGTKVALNWSSSRKRQQKLCDKSDSHYDLMPGGMQFGSSPNKP